MKIFPSVPISAIGLSFLLIAGSATAQELAIESVSVEAGAMVPVRLDYLPAGPATGVQADVLFDPAVLEVIAVAGGASLVDHELVWRAISPGRIRVFVASLTNQPLQGGTLATLNLAISTDAADGPLNVTPDAAVFGSPSGAEVGPATLIAGTLDVWRRSASDLSGRMVVVGETFEGGIATYLLTLTNDSAQDQRDNPGPEMIDQLPMSLAVVDARAPHGDLYIDPVTNEVQWSGQLAGGGSLDIEIDARIQPRTGGTEIANQAMIRFDADGLLGTNEAERGSDDPTTAQAGDPTRFLAIDSIFVDRLVGSLGSRPGELIVEGETISNAVTHLGLGFSEEVYDPPGDFDVTDVTRNDNYRLIWAGRDGSITTPAGCDSITDAEDEALVLNGILYTPQTPESTLTWQDEFVLPDGIYRLDACSGGIQDLSGLALDGNHDGIAGDDFSRSWTVERPNLLRNPDFGEQLAGWEVVPADNAVIEHSDIDIAGNPDSGSILIRGVMDAGTVIEFGQCVRLAGVPAQGSSGRVRIASALAGEPRVGAGVAWFSDARCGQLTDVAEDFWSDGSTGSSWGDHESFWSIPSAAQSAYPFFFAELGDSAEIAVHFDDLVFREGIDALFENGFESE